MLIAIIVAVAVLAFLIAICVIYNENIKALFKKKKKSKKQEPKPEPKQEEKPEDFIPLKNQYDDTERDASLDALFAEDDTSQEDNFDIDSIFGDNKSQGDNNVDSSNQSVDVSSSQDPISDEMFEKLLKRSYKSNKSKGNKPIAQQIKDLSPELKALLIDTALKKRDDV